MARPTSRPRIMVASQTVMRLCQSPFHKVASYPHTPGRQRTWKSTLHSQTHRQDGHERLVSHRVYDRPNHSLPIPFPRDPAVHKISDTRVSKEARRPHMLVVKDEIANDGSCDEPRYGQGVRDCIDILVDDILGARWGFRPRRGGRFRRDRLDVLRSRVASWYVSGVIVLQHSRGKLDIPLARFILLPTVQSQRGGGKDTSRRLDGRQPLQPSRRRREATDESSSEQHVAVGSSISIQFVRFMGCSRSRVLVCQRA